MHIRKIIFTISSLIIMLNSSYSYSAEYEVKNNGGNRITVHVMFAAPAVCGDWYAITLDPGQSYVSDHGSCCLRGVGLSSGGTLAGTNDNYTDLQGGAAISGPAQINKIVFDQNNDGSWSVFTGRR